MVKKKLEKASSLITRKKLKTFSIFEITKMMLTRVIVWYILRNKMRHQTQGLISRFVEDKYLTLSDPNIYKPKIRHNLLEILNQKKNSLLIISICE